ncbi:MAG TPA: saccharopine dehydrogenase C-terminal domain-containing protein [Thermoanaerobaculia bacterium]|nr:saccharopine dehydrogenase C-terminal domain-containing protein [Thermoanaerobaculia bacterium]
MKRVLALGAGLVAKPLVAELLRRPDVELTLAALDVERARFLVDSLVESLAEERHPTREGAAGRVRAEPLDAGDAEALSRAVAGADVVASLLPADLHPTVARACLEHRVPLVTTSYAGDAMRALDAEARARGVLLLNECGLDPGIDHMMAVAVIRRVEREGGRIVSFVSWAGGLPAPESAENPLRYKLSWSPRGVLLAARSPVRFLSDGRVVEHPSPYLPGGPERVEIAGVGTLEGFPNRDSLPYRALYGLEDVRDLLRGTLRYPGWSETLSALLRLGLLETAAQDGLGPSYCDLLDARLPPGSGPMPRRIARFLELPEDHPVLDRLAWLGLLSQQPLPDDAKTPLDALARLFAEKLRYEEGEEDLVVLEHRFEAHFEADRPDGGRHRITSRLVATGKAGDDSAMARTVGLPAALACGLILDGETALAGVQIPVAEELARPILAALAERGVEVVEEEEPM